MVTASPCTGVCTLDPAQAFCLGCHRTLGEIARWGGASEAERTAIVIAAKRRSGMNVHDNRQDSRFELEADGRVAIAAYERAGDAIIFTHTVVPVELRGQGVGSRLIAGALAQVRGEGLEVVPQCPFVAAYLRNHPDAADVAA